MSSKIKKNNSTRTERAFDGLKIVDFSWVIAGPLTSKYFADHGATVVKIESMAKPDMVRNTYPFIGNKAGMERSGLFANYNTSKYSCGLNLQKPESLDVARRLVKWGDVVIENFTPGVLERLGLGYESLKAMKPSIIMLSLSMHGQDGPHALQPGLGHMLQALTGFTSVIGWPERDPITIFGAFNDFIGPTYALVSVVAALEYRDRTGKGQHIDLSLLEAGATFLAPAVLDYTVNGRVAHAEGNRCVYAAPHGAYRCVGDDRWVAIAVFTDTEWANFCDVTGNPDWKDDPRFGTLLARKKNEDELDPLVEKWTSGLTPDEAVSKLQAAGVAAGVVRNGKDLCEDVQLQHRQYLQELDYPDVGTSIHQAHPFALSRTPGKLKRAPRLGEHTECVCREILGMSDAEFVNLVNSGVIG